MKNPNAYFVIYHKDTTQLISHHYGADGIINHFDILVFDAEEFAQEYIAKYLNADDYKIANYLDFKTTIEKKVSRINALTGKTFKEPINTPLCLSPSSDTYWSM